MFAEGDFIKFEIDPHGYKPRWLNNRDFGKSGKWAEGVVTEVTEYYFLIDSMFPNKTVKTVKFPNKDSTFYNKNQWTREGFLQECMIDWDSEEKVALAKKCECGGEKTNTTHSTWCPKFERLF
jgi:hypothetical protein